LASRCQLSITVASMSMVAIRSPAQRRASSHHILVHLHQSAQRGAFFWCVADLAHQQIPLRLPGFFGIVKLVQELSRRHAPVFTKAIEVFQAIPARGVERQEALDAGGFIEASIRLLQGQVALHAPRHIQRPGGAHEQWQAAWGSQTLFGRLFIDFEQALAFGWGSAWT
jgi:hypothetical protein